MRFFGFVNEVDGTLDPARDGHVVARVGHGLAIQLPDPGVPAGRVRLLLRAERIRVIAGAEAGQNGGALSGRIVGSDYLGMLVRYFVDVPGLRLQAIQPLEGSPYQNGEPVVVVIRPADWIVAGPNP